MFRRFAAAIGGVFRRFSYLFRAAVHAVVLGLIELVTQERGRRLLALAALGALGAALVLARPIQTVLPGEVAVRLDRLTGGASVVPAGWTVVLPGIQELRKTSGGDHVYRPDKGASARGPAPYQSVEGLSLGVDVTVRYALDLDNRRLLAAGLPDDVGQRIVEPVIDAVLHRTLAKHTVREIFSSKRTEIEKGVEDELRPILERDGVVLRSVFLGNVDLPEEYRRGLEALLAEELSSEKMRYTLELQEKRVKETELTAEAEKVRREKAAEAAASEEVIAAKGKAEAMKHILPFKEKEIEERRLEAEASTVSRLKLAEAEAQARRIEAGGEADYRRKLAESEAYRLEITGKATSEQLARDAALISKNPLLIQKTMADKLSDKVQVIIAPPGTNGFIAENLIGKMPGPARSADRAEARTVGAASEPAVEPEN